MSVAFDKASAVEMNSGISETFAFSPAGADRMLIVIVDHIRLAGVTTVASITHNGKSLSPIVGGTGAPTHNTGLARLEIWGLVNPDTSGNVVVTMTDSIDFGAAGAVAFTGVHQTTPLGSGASATDTSASASVTAPGPVSGDMVIGAVGSHGSTQTFTSPAEQTRNYTRDNSANIKSASDRQAGSDGGVISWTLNISLSWAAVAVNIKQTSAQEDVPRQLLQRESGSPLYRM